MREAQGDLFTWDDGNVVARVITTNGFLRADGSAVLGAGVAKQAVQKFGKALEEHVGLMLRRFGNHVHAFRPNPDMGRPYWLLTFPVKPAEGPNGEPGFKANAEMDLIVRSANELLNFYLGVLTPGTVVLPRPGCGNGKLDWSDVSWPLQAALDQPVRIGPRHTDVTSFGDKFVVVER